MKLASKIGLVLLLVAATCAGGVWYFIQKGGYVSRQTVARNFTIDTPFNTVRKVLVRKDGAKQIVTLGGGSEFISQEWDDTDFQLKSLRLRDPDYEINLTGTLTVRTLDDYIGQHIVTLSQQAKVTPTLVDSTAKLQQGTDRLLDYVMTTQFSQNAEGTTDVELGLTQEIRTHAPPFFSERADAEVKASAETALENQERAVRQFIDENKDNLGGLLDMLRNR